MATTTEEAFTEFEKKIAPTEAQKTNVTARAKRAGEFLRDSFPSNYEIPLRSALLMGSAKRGTLIRPVDDIDVLAIFNNTDNVYEKYRYDSQSFLYRLRDRIDAKTTVENVGARGQAVRLFYNDGLHVDIAPVFQYSDGGYGLPSGTGGWITTDPPKQEAWVEQREADLSGQFKRRVRMVRRWNAVHSKRLGSWHVEVMVGRVFSTMSSNHRNGLMKFFEWAPGYVHVDDPDEHGGDLGAGLTRSQEQAIKDSLAASRERAERAVAAEGAGDHKEAIRLWRIVLGDEFPAYGG